MNENANTACNTIQYDAYFALVEWHWRAGTSKISRELKELKLFYGEL